jgi:hypothetical protein
MKVSSGISSAASTPVPIKVRFSPKETDELDVPHPCVDSQHTYTRTTCPGTYHLLSVDKVQFNLSSPTDDLCQDISVF